METAIKPLDIHVIALNETDNWDLESLAAEVGLSGIEELNLCVKRIEGVYFFNRNERTHCCEVTPSYCLWPLENRARFKGNTDTHLEDEINDWISNEGLPYEPIYIHCHTVDALIQRIVEQGNDFRYRHYGNPELTEEELGNSDEAMEVLRQQFQANAPI